MQPGRCGRLADVARRSGLIGAGVMGYEGHIVGLEDRSDVGRMIEVSMAQLDPRPRGVGGDLVSAGGTGTYDINTWASEIQAGSYALMDTAYAKLGLPFVQALSVLSTVISVSRELGGSRLWPQGSRHGPRQPIGRPSGGVVLFGRAPDLRAREPVAGRGPHPGPARRTSIRPSPTTNASLWSMARRSSISGRSTCGVGRSELQDESTPNSPGFEQSMGFGRLFSRKGPGHPERQLAPLDEVSKILELALLPGVVPDEDRTEGDTRARHVSTVISPQRGDPATVTHRGHHERVHHRSVDETVDPIGGDLTDAPGKVVASSDDCVRPRTRTSPSSLGAASAMTCSPAALPICTA